LISSNPINYPSRILYSVLTPAIPKDIIAIIDSYHDGKIILSRKEKLALSVSEIFTDSLSPSMALISAMEKGSHQLALLAAARIKDVKNIIHLAAKGQQNAVEFLMSQAEFGHFEIPYFFRQGINFDLHQTIRRMKDFGHKELCHITPKLVTTHQKLGSLISYTLMEIWEEIQNQNSSEIDPYPSHQKFLIIKIIICAYLKFNPISDCNYSRPQHRKLAFPVEELGEIPCDCYENYPKVVVNKIFNYVLLEQNFKIATLFLSRRLKPEACEVDCLIPAIVVEYKPLPSNPSMHVRAHPVFRNLNIASIRFWLKHNLDPNTELSYAGTEGLTILMASVRLGDLEAVQALAKAGADTTTLCKGGIAEHAETPFECANRLKFAGISAFLSERL
jgi:hypothetical protein